MASVSAAVESAKATATGTDTVTATGLTRAHKIAAAATSSGVAPVSGTTVVQSVGSGFLAISVLSAMPSTSTASSSTSSKKPTSTSNGGTVLDQAGSSSGSRKEFGSALGLFSLGVCLLAGCMLL